MTRKQKDGRTGVDSQRLARHISQQRNGDHEWVFDNIKELVIFGRCENGLVLNAVVLSVRS